LADSTRDKVTTERRKSADGVESAILRGPGRWVSVREPGSVRSRGSGERAGAFDATERAGGSDARIAVYLDSALKAKAGVEYELSMPAGASVWRNADGGFDVAIPGKETYNGGISSVPLHVLATIEPAWALDDNGRPLHTWYEL
jgi:hypothetical protein